MCGRYYVDDTTAREIEKVIQEVDRKIRGMCFKEPSVIPKKDIHPTELAPILSADGSGIICRQQRWGLPGYVPKGSDKKGQIIFNARCESVMEKPSFRDGILHRRIAIPAKWFYEWNRNKEKNTFWRSDSPVLFMAGCYNRYEDGDHFVILTTEANSSMKPVHDRMPLILERDEIADWILDDGRTEDFLRKTSCLLERKCEYEQMSLF